MSVDSAFFENIPEVSIKTKHDRDSGVIGTFHNLMWHPKPPSLTTSSIESLWIGDLVLV